MARTGENGCCGWLKLADYQFNRALPPWEKAQTQLGRQLGDKRWHALMKLTNEVTTLVTTQGGLS